MKKLVSFFISSVLILAGCSVKLNNDIVYNNQKLNNNLIASRQYNNTVDLANSVASAVVGISADSLKGASVGSGVCVAANGVIITNSHVVNSSDNIEVYLADGSTSNAEVVWEDTIQDLAIIKANTLIPYLPISSDKDLKVGEDVVAVGTPLSLILKHSFTKGIVSALNRTLRVDTNYGESYMQNLIQHDASLNPGNSGGPLLNLKGEVVGINTLKISGGEGIGFAIPSRAFSSLVNSVVSSQMSYETPYIGVFGYDAEIARYNHQSDVVSGFYVIDVAHNSPLIESESLIGATIVQINGQKVVNTSDLKNELYKFSYGDNVKIEYIKDGIVHDVNITLAKNELR